MKPCRYFSAVYSANWVYILLNQLRGLLDIDYVLMMARINFS